MRRSSIISFVGSWNSYILPLIMLNSESKYPWPLGIMVYRGEFGTEWQLVLAFITLTILPTVIVFFCRPKAYHRRSDRWRREDLSRPVHHGQS